MRNVAQLLSHREPYCGLLQDCGLLLAAAVFLTAWQLPIRGYTTDAGLSGDGGKEESYLKIVHF